MVGVVEDGNARNLSNVLLMPASKTMFVLLTSSTMSSTVNGVAVSVSCQEGVWIMRKLMTAAAATIALASMQASAAEVKIDDLIVAKTISDAQRDTELMAAEGFYQFWNTGDESLLKAVISPDFTDHTLPPGRPQGPAFASKHFRAAAPDLTVEIRKLVVADDYVTVHMEFRGHFTGTFAELDGPRLDPNTNTGHSN
jgi:hypothetical protein